MNNTTITTADIKAMELIEICYKEIYLGFMKIRAAKSSAKECAKQLAIVFCNERIKELEKEGKVIYRSTQNYQNKLTYWTSVRQAVINYQL